MSALTRTLATREAVVIGLSSMLGVGAFVSFAGAYLEAGTLLPLSVVLAGALAWANAASTAQLSAQYPASGGVYHFGSRQLGAWWGFTAGWGFVIGKIASCAAMALVIAHYLAALLIAVGGWQAPPALTTVIAISLVGAATGINLVGMTRTSRVAAFLLAISVAVLLATGTRIFVGALALGAVHTTSAPPSTDAFGVLHGAAIMFFAFAGYARVATLAEEVREPSRTIPRAIMIALALVTLMYLALSGVIVRAIAALQGVPDAHKDAFAAAPFAYLVHAMDAGPAWQIALTIGAASAGGGALLALITGISRTVMAMAREGDLPMVLAHVSTRHGVPARALVAIGCLIGVAVAAATPLGAIEFSALGVLTYYFVANVAAWTQGEEHRMYPRVVHVIGALGCILMVLSLPWPVRIAGGAVMIAGFAYRAIVHSWGGVRGS